MAPETQPNIVSPDAEPEFTIPTAIPLATLVAPTSEPEPEAASPIQALTDPVEVLSRPIDRTLAGLEPGQQLQLLEEIPIPRIDFGIRLAFSPVGEVLLHTGTGLRIAQFDLATSQPISELTGFEFMSPLTISISPDGASVAADDGAQVRVWDSASGQLLGALNLPPVSALANAGFHADGLYFTVDFNGNVVIWDPRSWNETTRFSHPGRIESGILFPGGDAIALQDRDQNRISIYDLTGAEIGVTSFVGENARMLSVSPNGDRFLLHVDYGLPTERVEVVSADTGESMLNLPLLNFRRFAVSSDWSLLAAIGVMNELRLFELPGGSLLLSQQLGVRQTLGLEISPSGNYLGLIARSDQNGDGIIQVWGRPENTP
jgi:hypothetical protein